MYVLQVGFSFPAGVLVKESKSTTKPPAHLLFSAQSYPEFCPGFTTQGVFVPIDPLTDTSAVKFQAGRLPVNNPTRKKNMFFPNFSHSYLPVLRFNFTISLFVKYI